MAYDPAHVADYYASVFPARRDVYSRWTSDGWRPVREPLTGDIVSAGLSGRGPSISGYMIAPPGVSHACAIDFDTDDGLEQAGLMADHMTGAGIPAYVETSRRGAHLWCVIDRVVPALTIRAMLRAMLQSSGLPDDDPHIELRPGSDRVSADGLGHALRLPLMPHPKTGRRGALLHSTGTPVGGTLAEILLAIEWAPADLVVEWSERWRRPPVTFIDPDHRNPHEPYPEDDSTASEVLREAWGVQNAAPGRSVRCPAHDDRVASLSILRDDKRAICKAGHCILNNNDRGRGTYELRTLAKT